MKCRNYLKFSQAQNQIKWNSTITDSDWKTKKLVGFNYFVTYFVLFTTVDGLWRAILKRISC